MPARRPHGTSSVTQRGGAWYGRWRVGGQQVQRKLGPVREAGTRDGLTKAQAEVKDVGIAPSMGAVGSAYDNAMVESFWGRMQVELLNRKRWRTRIELATAIRDYIELFHNTRRRHSTLGMLSPTGYEANYLKTNYAA